MFKDLDRSDLLEQLISAARSDESVVAAALVGSLASGASDAWSDIDLALRLRPGLDPLHAARAWTERVQLLRPLADHLDVWAGPVLYRVLLLADSLQVDLSFWPHKSFASTGEPFVLLFGEAGPPTPPELPDVRVVIGWAWLYALHARSAIARRRFWQALQMVDELRDQLVALACVRRGLPPWQGRGVDLLPVEELDGLSRAVPAGPDPTSVLRAFRAGLDLLQYEVGELGGDLAQRLVPALTELQASAAETGTPPRDA